VPTRIIDASTNNKPNGYIIETSPSSRRPPPSFIDPLASIRSARTLHHQLMQPLCDQIDKARLAREIAGRLFESEAHAALSNQARILFLRIKTHAHLASLPDPPSKILGADIWQDYGDLESLLQG
jgi:hypothetical protein